MYISVLSADPGLLGLALSENPSDASAIFSLWPSTSPLFEMAEGVGNSYAAVIQIWAEEPAGSQLEP